MTQRRPPQDFLTQEELEKLSKIEWKLESTTERLKELKRARDNPANATGRNIISAAANTAELSRLTVEQDRLLDERGCLLGGRQYQGDSFSHNSDYSSVKLVGRDFLLQGRAADVIKILHKALESGHPWVHREHIASELNYGLGDFKVRDVFTTREVYFALVESKRKGCYRLRV